MNVFGVISNRCHGLWTTRTVIYPWPPHSRHFARLKRPSHTALNFCCSAHVASSLGSNVPCKDRVSELQARLMKARRVFCYQTSYGV